MYRYFTIVVGLFLSCNAYGQAAQTIPQLLKEQKLSGAVWTTVIGNDIRTYASGTKDLSTNEKLTSNHKVNVGSVTKPLLALGILRLVTEGKIALDEPVKSILPDLHLDNPWEKTSPITIRHLLDHTSGLSDLRLWHFFSSGSVPETPLSEFYLRNQEVLTIKAKPGAVFSYSNMGYTLLGMIIEKVSGKPYEIFLKENLLKPIGLVNSTFSFVSQKEDKNLAMGHFENGSLAPATAIYLRPAGQFTTTASDMGLLIRFILNKGKLNGKPFIDSTYFEELGKPKYTLAAKNGLGNGYGLGFQTRDRYGVEGLAHSGNIMGYRAMLYVFPEQNSGFFISINMDSETADYEIFNKTLLDFLSIKSENSSVSKTHSAKSFEDWSGYYVPLITRYEPFELLDIIGSFTKITVDASGMTVSPFQKKEFNTVHLGNGLFRAEDRLSASQLLYESNGKKHYTTGFATLVKTSGWKILILALSFGLGVLGLLGIIVMGSFQILKNKSLKNPVSWPLIAVVLLIISGILIAQKGIIFIGDKNAGAVTLYLGSILLSILVFGGLVATIRKWNTISFCILLLAFQLLVTLWMYNLVPFMTWH